ncbi:MAG: hypothetical protein IH865_13865, partial [Chloroflexi bacterium]|nr:hypothetical protein [Chloroflexota bacterium]
ADPPPCIDTKSVTVRVSGPESIVNDLTAEDFRATADLSDATTDNVSVPVRIESTEPRVDVLEVSPSQVTVRLEDVTFRTVPVRTNLVGTPPRGFEVNQITASPEAAIITGPESLVNLVEAVEADLDLTGVRISFDQTLLLQGRDDQGGNVLGINIEPGSAVISVEIEQLEFTSAFVVQPEITGIPATGFSVSAIEIEPPLVNVSGPAAVIQTIDPIVGIATAPVSIDGANVDVVRTVTVQLPEGTTVDQRQVTVRVVITTTAAALTFELPLDLINVEPGLLPEVDQGLIRVTLTGPLSLLAGVSAANIIAMADLDGLNAGEHTVEVEVMAPSGLTAILVSPSEVIVNLTAQ